MKVKFLALPTDEVRFLQLGNQDANGQVPEVSISDGDGNPCRHCLEEIPAGEKMLILAYRPFPELQPYAECGPIFLCGKPCQRHVESEILPSMFRNWEKILIRGYSGSNRIKYGTGKVVNMSNVEEAAREMLHDPEVVYVHMRSASNNCYQCRIERG